MIRPRERRDGKRRRGGAPHENDEPGDPAARGDADGGGDGIRQGQRIPYELALKVKELGRLPVVNFAAGGIATPADAALMMQLGCDGIFVGSGIFKSANPAARARAIVKATAYFNDPAKVLEASMGLGEAMPGLEIGAIPKEQLLAGRGW